jgi:hypothetical protein
MTGAEMIVAERARQTGVEGWTPEHDDEHEYEELVGAAICYAVNKAPFHDGRVLVGMRTVDGYFVQHNAPRFSAPVAWPWARKWDKREKHDRIRSLAIAGALLAAEIDRLQRKSAGTAESGGC